MDAPRADTPTRRVPPPALRAWQIIGIFCLGALGIAFAPIFVRIALPAPPVVTGFYRLCFALPVLALLVWIQGDRGHSTPRGLLLATAAGAFFGIDLSLWHLAVVETSVANATLLVNTTPVPVGLWTAFVLRRRPGRRFVVGAAFALVGTALLLGVDGRSGTGLGGGMLALLAALFYASYLIAMKSVRRGVDALRGILAASIGAVLVIGLLALLRGDPFTGFPQRSWLAFAGVALVSHVGGAVGIAWGLRFLQATFASVALLVQPLGAALLGWWLLGEALSPGQLAGGSAVLLGIFLASRSALDPESAPASGPATG